MTTAAAVTAGGGLFGSAISAGANYAASEQAWKRQKRVLQNQIRWRVADLKAAGLNPILAAGSPLGGSAPSVAMPNLPNFSQDVTNAAKAGLEANLNPAEKKKREQQARAAFADVTAKEGIARNQNTTADLNVARQVTEKASQVNFAAQAEAALATARQREAETLNIKELFPRFRAEGREWDEHGRTLFYKREFENFMNSFPGSVNFSRGIHSKR